MLAAIIGLTGKATAMPVENVSVGAACAAAAMLIHGVWPVSVNSIPPNPARSTWRASSAAPAQLVGPTITSKFIAPPSSSGRASFRSRHRQPAADRQRLPGDEPGVVGGEEHDRRGDVVGGGQPPERDGPGQRVDEALAGA